MTARDEYLAARQRYEDRPTCPDGGTCHHECPPAGPCFRVLCCGPLSGVYPGDEWPRTVRLTAFAADAARGTASPDAD